MKDFEKQAEGRKKLITLARIAKNSGYSINSWINDSQIKKLTIDCDLSLSVLEHISMWVWTYRRN
jgi:hypothetical protein